jgi:Mannosyltransferase putative
MIDEISRNSSTGGTIRTVDIGRLFPDPGGVMKMPGGWALRPFAILASSFKKVILTDADTVFLQDPSALLTEPGFMDTGAIFYRDRVLGPGSNDVYDWVDNILEEVNAKYLEDIKKNSEWFSRKTWYEMERY